MVGSGNPQCPRHNQGANTSARYLLLSALALCVHAKATATIKDDLPPAFCILNWKKATALVSVNNMPAAFASLTLTISRSCCVKQSCRRRSHCL